VIGEKETKMSQGKKHNDELKEKAFALLVTHNVADVAKKLNLPPTTLYTWKKQFDEGKFGDNEENLVDLRAKKKEEFVHKAWQLIDDAMDVAQMRVSRVKEHENNIDVVADAIMKNSKAICEEAGVGYYDLVNLVKEMKAIKNFKLSELSTLVGTIYDKQALANKEATSIMGGAVTIESIVRKLEGDEY
jgi:transposase-like protein